MADNTDESNNINIMLRNASSSAKGAADRYIETGENNDLLVARDLYLSYLGMKRIVKVFREDLIESERYGQ